MSFGFCPVCQYVLHPWSAVFTLLLHTNLLSMQCQDEDESDNSLPRTTWTTTPPPSAHLPISQPTAETPTSPPLTNPLQHHPPPTELHSCKDQKVQTAAANVSMLVVQTEDRKAGRAAKLGGEFFAPIPWGAIESCVCWFGGESLVLSLSVKTFCFWARLGRATVRQSGNPNSDAVAPSAPVFLARFPAIQLFPFSRFCGSMLSPM